MTIFKHRMGTAAFSCILCCLSSVASAARPVVGTWICYDRSPFGGTCIEAWNIASGGFHSSEAVCDGGISLQTSGAWRLQGLMFYYNYAGTACDMNGNCQQLSSPLVSSMPPIDDGAWYDGGNTCISTAATKNSHWYDKLLDHTPDAVEKAKKLIEDKLDEIKRDGRSARWSTRLERIFRWLR